MRIRKVPKCIPSQHGRSDPENFKFWCRFSVMLFRVVFGGVFAEFSQV
jgi:hypothetical protein